MLWLSVITSQIFSRDLLLYKSPQTSDWKMCCLEELLYFFVCFKHAWTSLSHQCVSWTHSFPFGPKWFADTHAAVAPVKSRSKLIDCVIQQLSAALYKCVLRALTLDRVWGLYCVYLHASCGLELIQRALDSRPFSSPGCSQVLRDLITILSQNDRWRLYGALSIAPVKPSATPVSTWLLREGWRNKEERNDRAADRDS